MKKVSGEKKIVVLIMLLFFVLLYFFVNAFDLIKLKSVQAISDENMLSEVPEVLINKNPVNISKTIEKNRNINIREEMIYEEQDLEYTTQYINNEDLPTGTMHVSQIGINGIQDVIAIKRYDGDELISEVTVASNIRKASINKIVEIGTGKR